MSLFYIGMVRVFVLGAVVGVWNGVDVAHRILRFGG